MAAPINSQIKDCIPVKTTSVPLAVLKEKARNSTSGRICALGEADLLKLFGRSYTTAEDYIFASDRVYSVVCMNGFQEGVIGFTNSEENYVNTCNYSSLVNIYKVTEQAFNNLILKETRVYLSVDNDSEHVIANKKLFKKAIIDAFKGRIIEKNDPMDFEYALHKFTVTFDVINFNQKSARITESTKLKLRKKEEKCKISFRDNEFKLSEDAIAKFYINMPAASSGELKQSQVDKMVANFLPGGSIVKEFGGEMRETHNSIVYRIKLLSVEDRGQKLKDYKIAKYQLGNKYKVDCSFESGVKVTKDEPVAENKALPVKIEVDPAKPPEPTEPIEPIAPEKPKPTFGEFLESRGLFGITPEMIKEIEVVLDYYGPEREVLEAFGIYPSKALLFHGQPGNGKTKVVEKIADYLKVPDENFIRVTGSDLLGGIVGSTEANIRQLFAKAEKEAKEKGDKSSLYIIYIDEIDALGGKREDASQSFDISKVTALLGKIDGVSALRNVLVIASTNIPDKLDSALKREGRFSLVEFKNPDEALRAVLFKHYLGLPNKRYRDEFNFELVAKVSEGLSCADVQGLANKARFDGYNRVKRMKSETKRAAADMAKDEAGFVSEADLLPLILKLRIEKKIVLNELIMKMIEDKMTEAIKSKEDEEKLAKQKAEREKEVLSSLYS